MRRRHHRRAGSGIRPLHLALAAGGLAYVTSAHGPKFVTDNIAKLPGSKTFGATAMLGVTCLAVDKWIRPNKWLRLAGYAGLVLAASRVGDKGSDFKWLGDDMSDYDMSGDDDMGDIGDDDMGDDLEGE